MVKVEVKTVKLGEIKLNPDNPRTISKKDMDLLVKSLKDFPEMLKLREIVVDETMTILGGNMRYLALQKSGAKEATAKVVTGLTPAQKREFIVKDNAAFGEWNMEDLANSWGDLPLADWGLNISPDWGTEKKERDTSPQLQEMKYQIVVECEGESEQINLLKKFDKEGLKCHALIL